MTSGSKTKAAAETRRRQEKRKKTPRGANSQENANCESRDIYRS
ncbi:hypothetical protein HMPREF7215_2540 [Pyramidobacter piscolens W5455]|uniref:Uncharacterized protein n=1 Tax=Pyramidobacter piscolens W5455 TaxID=352165 RepID=A0ABP2HW00_9BACT|nr:hypothetical protein HMPREF7215_2540 [Pyramidobacter piscolens W5455]